jgi:arylsulfatase A-like enzyme
MIWRSAISLTLVFSIFLITATAHASEPAPKKPNVLLILIDTLRADHLGCYGYERPTSPNIDRFSSTGTLFKNAYCQMPTTGPSHASIFTSRYPKTHGILKNGWVLFDKHTTLAEILQNNGYVTGAVISSFAVSSQFGFARGFESYDEEFPPGEEGFGGKIWEGYTMPGAFHQRGDVTTRKAVSWIRENKGKAFFLWAHYFDPHTPYKPPESYLEKFVEDDMSPSERQIALYDGEVRYVDDQVGKLLDVLKSEGLASDTIIIVMSDHGEGLGQHGWKEHGFFLYDEQAKIPLIFSFPGVIPEGVKLDSVVQSIDILPTLLDLLGLKQKADFSGRSMADMLRKSEESDGRAAYLERRRYLDGKRRGFPVRGDKLGVRQGKMKYIWAPDEETEELYDLSVDKHELSNIASKHPEVAAEMRGMIQKWQEEEMSGIKKFDQVMSQSTREKLKSLGYLD